MKKYHWFLQLANDSVNVDPIHIIIKEKPFELNEQTFINNMNSSDFGVMTIFFELEPSSKEANAVLKLISDAFFEANGTEKWSFHLLMTNCAGQLVEKWGLETPSIKDAIISNYWRLETDKIPMCLDISCNKVDYRSASMLETMEGRRAESKCLEEKLNYYKQAGVDYKKHFWYK
jgi:hypothetical protein